MDSLLAMVRPTKRSRTESDVDSDVPVSRPRLTPANTSTLERAELESALAGFSREDLLGHLLVAASTHSDTAAILSAAITNRRQAESTRVIDFDHYSKEAWYALNIRHKRLRPSQQYEVAGDVSGEIREMLDDMVKRSPAHASYGTRKSAVETMRKIFKSVCLSDGEIPRQVRQSAWNWDERMITVLECFTEEELQRLDEEEGWADKLHEVVELGAEYCNALKRLDEALDIVESAGICCCPESEVVNGECRACLIEDTGKQARES